MDSARRNSPSRQLEVDWATKIDIESLEVLLALGLLFFRPSSAGTMMEGGEGTL